MLTYKIDTFEGPLDLLLALLSKNKMNIADIQISVIFDQYMEYLEQMRRMDMEIAGEFIVMASDLMLIKSKMLLPVQESMEEDPRERLAQALIEYKKAKEVAAYLEAQYAIYSARMVKDTEEVSADPTEIDPQDVGLLKKALLRIFARQEREEEEHKRLATINPMAKKKVVPVSEGIHMVTEKIKKGGFLPFTALFADISGGRSEAVALFLAFLSLVKDGHVLLEKRLVRNMDSGVLPGSEPDYTYEYYCCLNPENEIPEDYVDAYSELHVD